MPTYLITGANRGIGLELCKQLLEQNHNVIATCRKPSKQLQDLNLNIIPNIDVTVADSLQALVTQLADIKVDVVINNAGIWGKDNIGEFAADKMVKVINTNAIAPLIVTQAVLSFLNAEAKLIFITSRMGSIADNTSGGRYSYRMSKAALNAGLKSLSIDLKPEGVSVGIIHPGHLATDMGGPTGVAVAPAVSDIIKRIDECDLTNTGTFWHANGDELPW